MEFIIISDSKMKITLTQKELDRYNIDSENFSIGNDAQRHAFRRVLNDACKQSGFEGSYSRLMVQMYPVKKGGCEIFVTRLDTSEKHREEKCTKAYESKSPGNTETLCYSFSEFAHLNAVCRQLYISGYAPQSCVYVSDSGTYYLLLDGISENENEYSALSFIGEFSKSSSQIPVPYLEEYCRLICEGDAVRIIGNI